MTQAINRTLGLPSRSNGNRHSSRPGASWGAQFTSSDVFQELISQGARRPRQWALPAVPMEMHGETLTSEGGSPGSGGDLIVPDYLPGILPSPTRRLTIADLIAPGTTDSNAVVYMVESQFSNAADTLPETQLKPESTLQFDQETSPVHTIAHWLPVTEQMLEDVPALRSYIDGRLRLGVLLAEDLKLLHGASSPEEIIGILNRAGLADPIAAGGSPGEPGADAIARQIAAIRAAMELEPDGIVMHPFDWLRIQLMKDGEDNYIGGGPFAAPKVPTLWGVPVVITSAITEGTALVGCFQAAAQLFRRGPVLISATNSHSDFFIRNKIAIRAEERLALAVYRPGAFGLVTGLN